MSSCVRPMRGVMTEVGGVMGVMAGDGPSESRMSLSGLSSDTSSVASVERQRHLLGGRPTSLCCRSLKRSMLIIQPRRLSRKVTEIKEQLPSGLLITLTLLPKKNITFTWKLLLQVQVYLRTGPLGRHQIVNPVWVRWCWC